MMLNGKNFTPCCQKKRVLGDRLGTIERLSMAFYGFTARVRRGTICPNVMGHVVRYRVALIVGALKVFGRRF
jgi:hypothetical protein